MKTPEAIKILKECQQWLNEPPELDNTGIYIDESMPNNAELNKALNKAVEVMEGKRKFTKPRLLYTGGNK